MNSQTELINVNGILPKPESENRKKAYYLTNQIYEISDFIREAIDVFTNEDGSLEPAVKEEIARLIDHKNNDLILDVALWVKETEHYVDSLKSARQKIDDKIRNANEKIDVLKTSIKDNLPEDEKIEDHLVKVGWSKSTRVELSVKPQKLPSRYVITDYKPDKKKLKKDLQDGKEVDGASLITSKHITIRS